MEQPDVLEIAATWSFWDKPVPASVPRRVSTPAALRESLALVIQGVRRCGKSTLMRQLMDRYRLNPKHCLFVNLEDPRLANALTAETLESLVTAFRAKHPRVKRLVFFLDEIQAVTGWERWLRSQLDRPAGHVFVVSGSNASLLSGELGAMLTGRHLTVELYPFDLQELRTARPKATLEDFLRDGGFPEPLELPEGDMLRRQYFHDIVERDIRERLAARSSRPIRQVVQMAYEAAGSELSMRRVAAAVGIATDTAGSYLDACEAAYLLFQVPYFATSERKRAQRNRKVYPIDTGLRRVVITPGSADRGKSLECATQLVLRRRFGEVMYWRGDGGEVDFVVQEGRRVIPVQVTWDEPQPRHEQALASFYETFPHADEAWWVTAETFSELDAR
ncbi:MAG: ATP-binding protein [Sandaracinaceae bacterium]|nr:ATP-binding protein [Sandaracinaceae bacterium]